MSRPADAAAELRAVLPPELVARLDLDNLQLQSGTHISEELRHRYSDLLFRTQLDEHPAFLYFLIEHQSSPDPMMALRVLDYLTAIWSTYHRDHPKARRLPVIIPLVVHASPTGRRWNAPTEFAELIDLPEDAGDLLTPYVPRLRFLLDDISVVNLDALRARPMPTASHVMLTLLKIAPGNSRLDSDMLDMLDALQTLNNGPDGRNEIRAILTYIIAVSDTPDHQYLPLFERLGPPAKELFVTTAEQIETRGRDTGRAEGRAEGRTEGRAEGRAEALIDLLTARFGPLPADTTYTIRTAHPEQLRAWTTRVLTAARLEEIFE